MSINFRELEGKILVVDDEPGIRHFLSRVLGTTKATIEIVENGKLALEQLRTSHDFTLVILDLSLPDVSGLDLLRVIRESHPSLPVVLSSGYEASAVPQDLQGDPNTRYLRKPYQIKKLWEVIGSALGIEPE